MDDPTDWTQRAVDACRRSCKHLECTGKGSTRLWAHRCSLTPPVPVDLGPCGIASCDAAATTMLPAGRRCPDHTPAQPSGYCAPRRCYCDGARCA